MLQVTFIAVHGVLFLSQIYGKRELLLEILQDIHGLSVEIHQMSESDLEMRLYQLLKKNIYLIVMDDLWDVGALHDLRISFPDDENGSQILITSRLQKVAIDARPIGDFHSLRLLSEEESWNLLEMKIFHKERHCPEELVEVGKKIAQLCKGLPLSVVTIAGILERTERKLDCWSKIAESLSLKIIHDPQTQCKDIVELSYVHLPLHLRECFLYFGAFLEDKDVSVSKLIRLWIAEGFIETIGPNSLEDTAEDYLMDLIDRSLVMISKRRSNGRVKSCSIYDLLRDFCLSKAKAGNLFHLITKYDEPYASFDGVDYGAELYHYCLSNPVSYESYRLCAHLKRKHFVDSRPSGPWTRSLMFLASSDNTNPTCHYDISFISQHFKLLTVLDLECINISNGFQSEIESLVHLRYLALSGDINSSPGSIAKLWRLETFIVKGSSEKIFLPGAIWSLERLGHLHVKNCAAINLQDDMIEGSFVLDNLVTCSSPSLSHGMENIIRRLPNLRKLSCIFCRSWDPSRSSDQLPKLDFLTHLETLRIIYSGSTLNSAEFNLPVSIKKLTLSNFGLPWNQIDAIARLPNLQILKLHSRAFEGPKWDMRDEEFHELKYLMLDTLNSAQWNASSNHLPSLQQLVVKNCKDLEEIPYDLAENDTLLVIEVQWCRKSVEQSVRNIKEAFEVIRVMIS